MEPDRNGNRLNASPRRSPQSGMTLIGMLLVACLVGLIGLAIIKIVPLYIERMTIASVMNDFRRDAEPGPRTPAQIISALNSRLYVENIELQSGELEVARQGQGYSIRITRELRAPYLFDLWFLVLVEEQVEISQ